MKIVYIIYYLLYFGSFISTAVGLSIVNTTYKINNVQIDNNNNFNVAIFTFTFDQDIEFASNRFPDLVLDQTTLYTSRNTASRVCFPPVSCFTPSNFSLALYDLITLFCPSETIHSSPQYYSDIDGVSPTSFLLLFQGGSKEPILNFFSQVLYLSDYESSPNNRQLHAILVLSYTINVPVELGGKIRSVDSELSQGKCRFNFNNASEFSIVGGDRTQKFAGNGGPILAESKRPCSYFESVALSQTIMETISNMSSAANWTVLQRLRFQNAILESSDVHVACVNLVTRYIDSAPAVKTFPQTTLCLRNINDPSFSIDPCCNITLQFFYCCAPIDKALRTEELNTTNGNVDKCSHIDKSSSVLRDFIVNANLANDPILGCRAVSNAEANTAIANRYTGFVQECLLRVFGTDLITYNEPPQCKNDADCFTFCSFANSCWIDLENIDYVMINCHLQLMDPVVKTLLKSEWRLPADINDADFRAQYFNHMSSENCHGYTAGQHTWIQNGDDYSWVDNQKDACLADMYCTYHQLYGPQQCTERGGTCQLTKLFAVPYPITTEPFCSDYFAKTQELCTAHNGTWDRSSTIQCTLPQFTTAEQCSPSAVCPPFSADGYQRACASAFCYDPSITQDRCLGHTPPQISYQWGPSYRNGSGLCLAVVANEAECANVLGASWWPGRFYNGGQFETQEKCEAGLCVTGNIINFPSGKCEDTAPLCSRTCHSCASRANLDSMCYQTGVPKDSCLQTGGSYFTQYGGLCAYNRYNESQCLSFAGYRFATCGSLTRDQCDSCAANGSCPQYYDIMQCAFAWNHFCDSEKQCNEIGGMCTDIMTFPNSNPDCSIGATFQPADCLGSCLHALAPSSAGQWECQDQSELYTPIGCKVPYIYTRKECDSMRAQGYSWHTAATTKDECESIKVCYEPDSSVTAQSAEECRKCNGTVRSLYAWQQGEWRRPHVTNALNWVPQNYTNTNTWQKTLDYNIVTNTIARVVAQQFSASVKTEALCLFSPIFNAINSIACDCAHDPTAPPDCFPVGTQVVNIGVHRFYAGLYQQAKASSVKLTVFENTISPSVAYVDVDIEICYSSQFRTSEILTTNALSSSLDKNSYAIIKNKYGAKVGQLVGDGVVLTFLPGGQVNLVSPRALVVPTGPSSIGYTLKNPMFVCVALRDDIPKSHKAFPVMDIAISTANWTKFTPMEVQVNVTADGYCFLTREDGRFFPILRVADWKTRKNSVIDDNTLLAFIYIFGVVMVLLSFVCIYQMWVAWGNMRASHKLNLAMVLFFFMFLFTMVRGLYLLILPSGSLEHSNGAKYFLSEAPQFFFFSVYTVIIFAWAELCVTMTPRSFLEKFRWPFILTNVGLYILFIVVVSIYQSISTDDQLTLRKVYVFILASCCIAAVIAFNVFGIKLIVVQVRAKRIATDPTSKNSTLKKLFILLPVSSITLLAQIAFLFVVTYSYVSPRVALSIYVVTEVIPAATLIFTLKPLSRKLAKNRPDGEASLKKRPPSSLEANPSSSSPPSVPSTALPSSSSVPPSSSEPISSDILESDQSSRQSGSSGL